jgi:hypothetical protein
MKNAEITATTFGELKQNWNMYKAAIDKLFAYVRRSGQNLDYFVKLKSGQPTIKGYDMMMRRTAGKFSPKEWYNCIIY